MTRLLRFILPFVIALAATAHAAEVPDRRDCTFERNGRPIIRSRCFMTSGVLNGVADITIRLDDGKALHLEGPLAGSEDRYRLQGGKAHSRAGEAKDVTCYERDDQGMTLCIGQRAD